MCKDVKGGCFYRCERGIEAGILDVDKAVRVNGKDYRESSKVVGEEMLIAECEKK